MHLQNATLPTAKQKAFTLIELPAVRKRGFTLIELLIVISIIALLASILMPAINTSIRSAYGARTEAIVKSMRTAIIEYYNAEQHYPGQRNSGAELSDGDTGSRLLARALFTNKDDDFPRTGYMAYKSDMLAKIGGYDYTISDGFPRPMAICYYYSRGKGQDLGQFHYADNNEYTDGNGGSQATFENAIKDKRYDTTSTTPYGDGGYLLIAPGTSREYFDGQDDKMGW